MISARPLSGVLLAVVMATGWVLCVYARVCMRVHVWCRDKMAVELCE